MTRDFFEESTEASQMKASIVSKYFRAWAKVVLSRARRMGEDIAYVDLFAGPGRYEDGTQSTPLLVLGRAVRDDAMCRMLVTVFNDANPQYASSLSRAIENLPGIERLKHRPKILNEEVGERIIEILDGMRLGPTLLFVDPWGYKGLTLELVHSVLKNWGCDVIFFFNYNRISPALSNRKSTAHMNELFGKARADDLRRKVMGRNPAQRELIIVEAVADALKEIGGQFVLPFTFKRTAGVRTSHHLIFVSKNVVGYKIMKEIMAKESLIKEQGVSRFEYNPAVSSQGTLFELSRPLEELGDMLLAKFAGSTLTVGEVYESHHVGRRFVLHNYKDVLMKLEQEGRISVDPPLSGRRKGTLADRVLVRFPAQGDRHGTINHRVD